MYYDEIKPDVKVNVLGTEYGIWLNVSEEDDEILKDAAGYCDKTTHRISVMKHGDECNLGNVMENIKYILRHELIHAFLFESGIGGEMVWDIDGQEHPEHMIEWIARQFPKMLDVFTQIDAL